MLITTLVFFTSPLLMLVAAFIIGLVKTPYLTNQGEALL